MQVRRELRVILMLLVLSLQACAGGSGSSGFDVASENAAIRQALSEQRCVVRDGLTICPAGPTAEPGIPPTATPTSTASPTADLTPLATPTRSSIATATQTPTTTPTQLATNTAVPGASPRVDTGLDNAASVACVQSAPSAPCSFILLFAPLGFPPDAVYRVAVRLDGTGRWSIGPAVIGHTPTDGSFDAPVAVALPGQATPSSFTVQLAVLVFLNPSTAVPPEVDQLADTGASFAFLTAELPVQAQTSAPGLTDAGLMEPGSP